MRLTQREADEGARWSSEGEAQRMVHAEVDEGDGVVIVTPACALSDPLPEVLAEQLGELLAGWPMVVDLSSIAVASAASVAGLAGWILGADQPDRSCVVCARPGARAQLREWHVTRRLAVFGSIGDALQARRFAHDGYGRGWRPDRPDSPPVVEPRPRPLPLGRHRQPARQPA